MGKFTSFFLVALVAVAANACEFADSTVCTNCESSPDTCASTIMTYCDSVSWSDSACDNVAVVCPFALTAQYGTDSPCEVDACVGSPGDETACVTAIQNYCMSQSYLNETQASFAYDTACANVQISPQDPTETILLDSEDGTSCTFTGSWAVGTSTSISFEGSNYYYSSSSSASATFTYTFTQSGFYTVGATIAGASNRDSAVQYTVVHALGSTDATIDQTTDTAVFVSLGDFYFTAGFTAQVTVHGSSSNKMVTVDALRFKLVIDTTGLEAQQEIFIDNDDGGDAIVVSAGWSAYSSAPHQGATYLYGFTAGATVQYLPVFNQDAKYEIFVTFGGASSRSKAAQYTVVHAGGTSIVNVDQTLTTGDFVTLGVFSFKAGAASVTLTVTNTGSVSADSVKFIVRPTEEILLDNDTPSDSIAESAFWISGSTSTIYRVGASYLYTYRSEATITYSYSLPISAQYEVLATFGGHSTRSTNVVYTITYSSTESPVVVTVDQTVNSPNPTSLGVYTFARGVATVTISIGADGKVMSADSMTLKLYVPQNPQAEIFIDSDGGQYVSKSSFWYPITSSSTFFYGTNYYYSLSSAATLVFSPSFEGDGAYEVFIYYQAHPSRYTAAVHTITHADGTTVVNVDQTVTHSSGLSLGTFNFVRGTTGKIQVTGPPANSGSVAVDAIRLVLVA